MDLTTLMTLAVGAVIVFSGYLLFSDEMPRLRWRKTQRRPR
jgi:hypothetical protein